ncbi:conserved hypothetical protein [uncultured Dysgonomonas sp.]|uniref:Uncharacterized protein n=2 Tax=uncultured Dysgonomonas sp. TaxID=206096 RepID=A0A212JDH9_9BACT|nr:conserved hypothetical protein [uncultured Dysgonomonas sp.]
MKRLRVFITQNKSVFFAMFIGLILGYLYWYFWGCYWGAYPMSSECWVDCVLGFLFGGFVVCIIEDSHD